MTGMRLWRGSVAVKAGVAPIDVDREVEGRTEKKWRKVGSRGKLAEGREG